MNQIQVTSVSSKGQVVIPTNVRESMRITTGTKLIMFTDGENLLLKPIQIPQFETFKKLVKESRKILEKTNIKAGDIKKIIKQTRNENRS